MIKFILAVVTALTLFAIARPVKAEPDAVQSYIQSKCVPEYGKAHGLEKARFYAPLVRKVAEAEHLDPQLLAALVWYESNYNPRCVSPCGALGLTQVVPYAGRFPAGCDRFDPVTNLRAGARMLNYSLRWVDGHYSHLTPTDRWNRALVAYNMGPGGVSRGIYRSDYSRAIWRDAQRTDRH